VGENKKQKNKSKHFFGKFSEQEKFREVEKRGELDHRQLLRACLGPDSGQGPTVKSEEAEGGNKKHSSPLFLDNFTKGGWTHSPSHISYPTHFTPAQKLKKENRSEIFRENSRTELSLLSSSLFSPFGGVGDFRAGVL